MVASLCVTFASLTLVSGTAEATSQKTSEYIVQYGTGAGSGPASSIVAAVGGHVDRNLGPISAVSATLDTSQVQSVEAVTGVQVTPDVSVTVQDTTTPGSTPGAPVDVFAQQTGANSLWASGDTGSGVNVAVLDTGIDPLSDFSNLVGGVDLSGESNSLQDNYGHGTFVAGLIAGNGASSNGAYTGEAPGAGLVSVKVAGVTGVTDLATVIAGVDWTIEHSQTLNIGVLNLSLGFVPFESTTINPLDQAVEQAWNSGIVVVASAGNAGPFNGTVLSPGDDPLIITAGAVSDNGSTNPSQDTMQPFSSVGPTFPDGWFKPDLVASGRSVISLRAPGSTIDLANPTAEVGTANFVGSGTSFSSAITAGAAALVLSAHPNYTPNQVKAALLGTTSPGPTGNPFVDGHGVLNVAAAVAANKASLTQNFGDVVGSDSHSVKLKSGDIIEAGYAFTVPGPNQAATDQVLGGTVALPVSCSSSPSAPIAGWDVIKLATGPYGVAATSNKWIPDGNQNDQASFQGLSYALNYCNGAAMYTQGAMYSAEVNSTDTTDSVQIEFHFGDLSSQKTFSWDPPQAVTPISTTAVGANVNLSTPWALSSWNPANWSGITPPTVTGSNTNPVQGSAWNGSAWNGSAWNGSAWNGSAWNGSAWNGSAWNGSAWNGSAWNGSAWNGSAWNGSAWNGSAWN
jgi:serine protease AprX